MSDAPAQAVEGDAFRTMRKRMDEIAVRLAAYGKLHPADSRLPPRLWEDLRILLQQRYREATGEPHATLIIAADAHPLTESN